MIGDPSDPIRSDAPEFNGMPMREAVLRTITRRGRAGDRVRRIFVSENDFMLLVQEAGSRLIVFRGPDDDTYGVQETGPYGTVTVFPQPLIYRLCAEAAREYGL